MRFHTILALCALLSSASLWAEGKSVYSRSAYGDQLYLGNIRYGSSNPVSISYTPLPSVADIRVGYDYQDGNIGRVDLPSKTQWWSGNMYGIKQYKRATFEGSISYRNGSLENKRWNSSLFVSPDNPYIAGDSIRADFSTELFHLDGAISYQLLPKMHLGLRARYDVGSTANQRDPRPDTKGMRFQFNPGVDYSFGAFNIGLSGHYGWLSESMASSVIKTTVNHFIFIFQGMGFYEAKNATGFYRQYDGTDYGINLQFAYDKNQTYANFLSLGYDSQTEEAVDGSGNGRYKGGKYDATHLSVSDRFEIRALPHLHNITLKAYSKDIEGTWSIQQQATDADGNVYWEEKYSSVNHTEKRIQADLAYRYDFLGRGISGTNGRRKRVRGNKTASLIPLFTGEIQTGFIQSEMKHAPEGRSQKYSLAILQADLTKRFKIRRNLLKINLAGGYQINLSDSYDFAGIRLADKYTQPNFEGLSASILALEAGASFSLPLSTKGFDYLLEPFARYSYKKYIGEAETLKNTQINGFSIGLSMIF